MISKWNNLKSQLSKILKKNKEKDYLEKLVQNLEFCHRENKSLPFIIISQKKNGFVVKVAGLYAYVSFNHMSWKYKNIDYWNVISKHLIGEKFYCTIYQIGKNPISILINAENHRFEELKLDENSQIKGIILAKAKYGVFVELGSYFNWKYGSYVGLLHKSNFYDFDSLTNMEIGEEIPLTFYGYDNTDENRIILGDKYLAKEWFTSKMDNLIGSIQKVKVIINDDGKKEFYVKDKYKAVLPINMLMYPEYDTQKIRTLFDKLENEQTINCKVVDVKYKTRRLILKWNRKVLCTSNIN